MPERKSESKTKKNKNQIKKPIHRPTLKEFKERLFKDAHDKALYNSLKSEYRLLEQMIEARIAAGLSQDDVAKLMGTRKSNISRLENSLLQDPSPNLSTLKKYAAAVNCHIEINIVPNT